jgi:phosphoribosyl 1,2-cyclic phosphodiesterase
MFWRRKVRDAADQTAQVRMESVFSLLIDSSPRVRVHAAPEHQEDVEELIGGSRDLSLIEFVPLEPTERIEGDGTLTSFPLPHREGELCFGFRLDWQGRSLAYVTDTCADPGAPYVEELRGVDVLLHECYMPDDEPDLARRIGHSHITPVAQVGGGGWCGSPGAGSSERFPSRGRRA